MNFKTLIQIITSYRSKNLSELLKDFRNLIVIVFQINDIKENFKSAEFVYNSLEWELKDKIEIWTDIAKRKKIADSVKYYTK